MTLREEVLKSSGILTEMPMVYKEKYTEVARTPVGSFYFENKNKELEVGRKVIKLEDMLDYINSRKVTRWDPYFAPVLIDPITVIIGYSENEEYQAAGYDGERAETVIKTLVKKLDKKSYTEGVNKLIDTYNKGVSGELRYRGSSLRVLSYLLYLIVKEARK